MANHPPDDETIRSLTSQRNRYRMAWQSARQRAEAYGEGILRHVADRDFWKEQCKAAGPSAVDEVVAALQAKAQGLSEQAEQEMRRDLEEQAQVWHEAAELVRKLTRTSVKEASNA